MVKPFADFDEYREQEEAKGDQSYESSMLTRVIKALMPNELNAIKREAGDEFGFRWFNNSTDQCRIALDAMHKRVRVYDLLRINGVTTTELWRRYFDLLGEYGEPFGLIFPVPGLGQWIMHNDQQLPREPGYAHIARISGDEAKRLTIQPLPAFLAAVKRV